MLPYIFQTQPPVLDRYCVDCRREEEERRRPGQQQKTSQSHPRQEAWHREFSCVRAFVDNLR